jgi:hypothetical protein
MFKMQLPPQCIVVGDIIREKTQMSSTEGHMGSTIPEGTNVFVHEFALGKV